MAKVHRPRTFRYKVAKFPASKAKRTLQQRLRDVFGHSPKPAQRTQSLSADEHSAEHVVIFYRTEHKNLTCGILQRFRPGAPALATIMQDDADNYEIKMFAPPNDPKKKMRIEFAKSLMFFGVRANHVVVSEGRGFGSAELEFHLSWLFDNHSNAKTLEDSYVSLDDNIPPGYVGRRITKAKEVKLFSEPELIVGNSSVSKKSHGNGANFEAQSWTLQDDPLVEAALNALKKSNPNISKEKLFSFEDAFQKGDLRAELTLKFAGRRKAETSPLDEFARTLRHINDIQYEITLPKGEPLKSEQTKITRKYNIIMNHDVPDPGSVFSQMAAMLDDLVQGGDIVPDP